MDVIAVHLFILILPSGPRRARRAALQVTLWEPGLFYIWGHIFVHPWTLKRLRLWVSALGEDALARWGL